jgi:low temperature requirement protein LtrA
MSAPEESKPHVGVGWFELFYDLVIVAAVSYTAHAFIDEPTWEMGLWIAGSTFIMFRLWLLTVLNHNLDGRDRQVRRLLILLQMLALVVAALATAASQGLPNGVGFGALAVAFATITAIYAMTVHAQGGALARQLMWSSGIGAVVLLAGVALPDDATWSFATPAPWILLVGVGAASAPLLGRGFTRVLDDRLLDHDHLAERLGQLIIIVLGEAFLSLVSELSGLPTIPNPTYFVLTFVVIFAIWTIYFSSILPAGMPDSVTRVRPWLLVHWVLMFGAIASASAFSALTTTPFVPGPLEGASAWTTLPLALVMLALGAITALARGRVTRLAALHLGSAAALLVLAAVGLLVSAGGSTWEVAVGSVIVIANGFVCAAVVRPYSVRREAGAGTPLSGTGPSPS